jgi:hypothetical protein
MNDVIQRFLEGDGNPEVGRVLLSGLDDGLHHAFNFNLFDVTIDPAAGTALIEDVLGSPDSTTLTLSELRQLAGELVDQGREDV